MIPPQNRRTPKKPVKLGIDGDLLRKARAQHVDLSATLKQALPHTLRERRRKQWLVDNRQAIEAYNEHVTRRGVFSDGIRCF